MYELRSELHLSQKTSIDAFLEHRPEFLKSGKTAIALSLLSNEDPGVLNSFDVRDKGIYHFLYNSLAASWEEFRENKLTIVTFNYDRSLEFFLFSALKHSYNKSDTEIAEAIAKIPIIHVHGSLGPLPWQASDGSDYYPLFGRNDTAKNKVKRVKLAAENIVIVSEAEPKSKEFTVAIQHIQEADKIYFLGFGYFRVNLGRLGLSQLPIIDQAALDSFFDKTLINKLDHKTAYLNMWLGNGKAVDYSIKHFRGSALGLGHAQMKAIQEEWRFGLLDNKCDALEFLKEHADLS